MSRTPSPNMGLAILPIIINLLYTTQALPLEPRLTLADEWNGYYISDGNGPGSYTFGYDLEDPKTGNVQYRVEEKYPNGTVTGSYGLLEPDGNVKVVKYVADKFGYRATVEDSNQKYPRYHPPLTSRNEEQQVSEESLRAFPFQQGLVQSFGPFSQSIQEIRTPPKFENSFPDIPYNTNLFPDFPGV